MISQRTGLSKNYLVRCFKGVLAAGVMGCLILLSVACSTEPYPQKANEFTLSPPESIVSSRMVDPSQLVLTVEVDGTPVEMTESTDGGWSGNIGLTAGTTHSVLVSWNENIDGQPLLLARALKSVLFQPGDSSAQIVFDNNEFNTSYDADSDGRSNLSERDNGSDPFDANSPEAPPIEVAVEIQLNIPNTFQAASVNSDELTMVAFVNNQSVSLTRSEQMWVGGVSLTENSDAFIAAQLFRDNTRSLRIGVLRKTTNVGSGGLIVIPDTDFDFNLDDDGDGLTNLEEILNGYDPLDSNDPVPDPCQPTQFVQGCPTDTDNDGDTDFQETETADSDFDTIPDYLESNIDDVDEDLFTAQNDPDDMDPCNPSPESLACLSQP